MSLDDDNKHRIKLPYTKEIEIALDDLQMFTQCYKELLSYHRDKRTQPDPMDMMEQQDKINQAMLLILEWLLEPSGYSTRLI
jgi:hypothetical protein